MKQTVLERAPSRPPPARAAGLDAGWPPATSSNKGFVKIEEVGDLSAAASSSCPTGPGRRAMKAAVAVLQPAIDAAGRCRPQSRTVRHVAGDIHEIGKTIVCSMPAPPASASPTSAATCPSRPSSTGARAADRLLLLAATTTMPNQQKTIEALKAAGLRDASR